MTPQGMADNLYFGSIISHTNDDDDDAKSKLTLFSFFVVNIA